MSPSSSALRFHDLALMAAAVPSAEEAAAMTCIALCHDGHSSSYTFIGNLALIFAASPSRSCAPNTCHPSLSYPLHLSLPIVRYTLSRGALYLFLNCIRPRTLVNVVKPEPLYGEVELHEHAPESADLGSVLVVERSPAKLAESHLSHHTKAMSGLASISQLLPP